jgi:hypothetical protein
MVFALQHKADLREAVVKGELSVKDLITMYLANKKD